MQSNELRNGNYVMFQGRQIQYSLDDFVSTKDNLCPTRQYRDISPIPLSVYRLALLGLEPVGADSIEWRINPGCVLYIGREQSGPGGRCYVICRQGNAYYSFVVKFLHELQNAYEDITGRELIYKSERWIRTM